MDKSTDQNRPNIIYTVAYSHWHNSSGEIDRSTGQSCDSIVRDILI